MGKFIDIVGQKFNRLLVLEQVKNHKRGGSKWRCLCDCGKITDVIVGKLTSGKTASCGCLGAENRYKSLLGNTQCRIDPTANFWKKYFYCYQKGAKENNRNYVFELTLDEFKDITTQNCHYCGAEPVNNYMAADRYKHSCSKQKHRFDSKFYEQKTVKVNGIDRRNNTIGYVLSNVVPCCKFCNRAKSNRKVEEYEAWILQSAEFINNRR